MIDTRGMDPNMENAEACNDGIYLYNPWSGINTRETHRYFIEEITTSPHLKVLLSSRLVSFQEMLKSSERLSINLLAKMTSEDCRTIHRSNLKNIARDCNISRMYLTSSTVKQVMKYKKVPTTEEWKILLVNELIQLKNGDLNLSNFEFTK